MFGTLAFALFYTGFHQRQNFLAAILGDGFQAQTWKLPRLAGNAIFRRVFAGLTLVYGLATIPMFAALNREVSKLPVRAGLSDTHLPASAMVWYLLIALAIVMLVFLVVFFDFHSAQLCWLLLPFIGGPVFALLALVGAFKPVKRDENGQAVVAALKYADKA